MRPRPEEALAPRTPPRISQIFSAAAGERVRVCPLPLSTPWELRKPWFDPCAGSVGTAGARSN